MQIAVRIPDEMIAELDHAIATGRAANRAEALRQGLQLLLHAIRDQEIADEYAAAYGKAPQEAWIGQAGLALGAQILRESREPQL